MYTKRQKKKKKNNNLHLEKTEQASEPDTAGILELSAHLKQL